MNDGKIHIPGRKKSSVSRQRVIRVTEEAYNTLVDIQNESTLSIAGIASLLIMYSIDKVVFVDDGKIHIPARKESAAPGQRLIRVTGEAYNELMDICNESTLSITRVASLLIMRAVDMVVFDEED